MKPISSRRAFSAIVFVFLACGIWISARALYGSSAGSGAAASAKSETASPDPAAEPPLVQADALVKVLGSTTGPKPLVLQVGFYVLYLQAHVPGAEYVGPASSPDGIQKLRRRVEKLPRSTPLVIYCGCCPWSQCPVIHPAYDTLRAMGFTNVKALYIPRNFGVDWVQRGYPVTRGQ